MYVNQVTIIATEYVRDFKIEESMNMGRPEVESAGGRPYQRRTFKASDLSHVNGRTHGRASTHTMVHPLDTSPGDSLSTVHCAV